MYPYPVILQERSEGRNTLTSCTGTHRSYGKTLALTQEGFILLRKIGDLG